MQTTTERPAATVVTVIRPQRRTGSDVQDGRPSPAPSRSPGTSAAAPTRGVRLLLTAFCCLTAAAVVSLVVLADRTEVTFAWTIEPTVSAAFLGSGYGAGFVLSVLAVRSRDWWTVRVPFLTVLVFAWITTGATLYHLHRLHMQEPGAGPAADAAAWLWLAVYAVVPVTMTVLLPRQPHLVRRADRGAPAVPLPRPLTVALVAEGLVLAAVGLALVGRSLSSHGLPGGSGTPGAHGSHAHAIHTGHGAVALAPQADGLWPWTLAPLGAGVTAAWLLAFAVAVGLCVADGDLARLRIATAAYTAFGALELVNLLRFRDELAWSSPAAWAFVAMALAVTATGAAGWLLARRR